MRNNELFNEDDTWTNKGAWLAHKIRQFMIETMDDYDECSPRDIAHIANSAIIEAECDTLIKRRLGEPIRPESTNSKKN